MNKNINDFKQQLSKCKDEDFNGHTNFRSFTPEQKLEWLFQLVQFTYECRLQHK